MIKDESSYIFLEDSDFSIANSDNTGSTYSTADLETLQYLNNKDTSLKSLNDYPRIKFFFKYNTCLHCGATLFCWGNDNETSSKKNE